MVQFVDLPPELIPLIVTHILRPQHLAHACLVNKDFYTYTILHLYERTAIFAWHKEGKKKATKLFWTLANCPRLARYVKRLELRDFPKGMSRESAAELTNTCVRAIHNCINLFSCTWTRDGSLKDDILDALTRCRKLEVLEFNGRHHRNYDPALLSSFSTLRKLTVIMPSGEVVGVLPACFENNYKNLQTLSIICRFKFSPLVTDSWLRSVAPTIAQLEHLHIAGCPKVTQHGIICLLDANTSGLTDLALEGVSTSFDMAALASYCARTSALARLQSLTLAVPLSGVSYTWLAHVEALLADAPLRSFHLYASGAQAAPLPALDALFVQRLVTRHAPLLRKFAVLRLPLGVGNLDFIVRNSAVEQLFVTMRRSDLGMLGPTVAQSHSLRSLHVTYSYIPGSSPDLNGDDENEDGGEDDADDIDVNRPLPSMDELETIARHFGPRVTQFGVQTRVWQVERPAVRHADGSISTTTRLGPYESPDVPDIFLVVRA